MRYFRKRRTGKPCVGNTGLACFAGLLLATLPGCPKTTSPPPPEPEPGQAPIDEALRLAASSRGELRLPQAAEARYTLPITYPVIDQALASPLALAPWGDSVGRALDSATDLGQLWATLRPLSPAGSDQPGSRLDRAPNEAVVIEPSRRLGPSPTEAFSSEKGQLRTAHLPPAFVFEVLALATVLEKLAAASVTWGLEEARAQRPNRAAEEFFIDAHGGIYRFRTHPIGVQLEFLEAAASLDFPGLLDGAQTLLAEVERRLPVLVELAEDLPASAGPLLHLDSNMGPIVVGSKGPDVHASDALLLIDPGGDDRWENNAGSNVGPGSGVALAIDLGGDDTYQADRDHIQGAGFFGIGMLVDQSGNDRYEGRAHAQGAGFAGVGVLWDREGSDLYKLQSFGQGAGTLGAGFLIDQSGNDRAESWARSQGFGATGGLGALLDLQGDDQRLLGVPGKPANSPEGGGGQGAGWGTRPFPWHKELALHGGVGLLYDREGADAYYARAWGQGAAWFLSLGLLLDRSGNDQYIGELSSQGSAAHLGAALLIDSQGADRYHGAYMVQGAAQDRSVGVLWDRGDHSDHYVTQPVGPGRQSRTGRSQGYARQARALGILVDDAGDDHYSAWREALGDGLLPNRPGRDPLGLFVDLAGTDAYQVSEARPEAVPLDGRTWVGDTSGVGMDTFAASPGWTQEPLMPLAGWGALRWERDSRPPTSWVANNQGDATGNAEQRWLALENLYTDLLGHDMATPTSDEGVGVREESEQDWVRTAALTDPSPAVRRHAARVLVARGELLGLEVLIASLAHKTEETANLDGRGGLRRWLQRITGQGQGGEPVDWSRWWREHGSALNLSERWPAVAALERAERASGRGDIAALELACRQVIESAPDDPLLRSDAAALLSLWTWVLGHPETSGTPDPARAVELGQLAVSWEPDQPAHFLHLARAWTTLGEYDLARLAIEKASLMDPDDPWLVAVRRKLEQLASAPEESSGRGP
ncbi:MAG TPA: hypothetical protein DIU15_15300 [Deltaproteobacteria bacterium]|nr:hypothetical protein [Deltaproteobacteria bacterium]HCP47407.1 hypothetical protein [Deltaproteobacteria bacterium]